ncbi:MAG: hypothetical protein CL489_06120 [Acidobacteria bacterium]|nr:hypothetical protein [Acidobacteriota bacterium]|tara:strand:+ start:15585 stop:16949 length:1365 start_codon:yes stop_codon:yes gene_type:complete
MASPNDALIPELWAQEAINLMWENFLFGQLFHTEFKNQIAVAGDVVNTSRPVRMRAHRKNSDIQTINDQTARSTNIKVELNQQIYVSFLLGSRDRSLSFVDLTSKYLVEAMQAQIRMIDRSIAGHIALFLANAVGTSGTISASNAYNQLTLARKKLNDYNVPEPNRRFVFGNRSDIAFLQDDRFINSDYNGMGGTAVREAYLGRTLGFDMFRSPNLPMAENCPQQSPTTVDGAAAAGATTIDVATGTAPAVNSYIEIAGEGSPNLVTGVSTDTLTLKRPLRNAVADGAAVKIFSQGAVNNAAGHDAGDNFDAKANGYAANWAEDIAVDGNVPAVGQIISFASHDAEYVVVNLEGSNILLDRPLEAAIDDNDTVALAGDFELNFAFNPKAIGIISRPLAVEMEGTGVRSAIAEGYGFGVRVDIGFDGTKQAQRVTISSLLGLKQLDEERGVPLLA